MAISTAAAVLAGVFCAHPQPAAAGSLSYFAEEGSYRVHLTTLQELKYRSVIRQKYDFSCGSAALATLLTYHYGIPVQETNVFADMWEHGDKKKIEHDGFSMLDMQQYLARRGIRANGYRTTLDRVVKADVPGLVLMDFKGYMHFVIIEGVRDGRVLIADPALGTRALNVEEFGKDWNGILFVVLDHLKEARATFNRDQDWAVQPRAPVGAASGNATNLANMLLSLPARNVF